MHIKRIHDIVECLTECAKHEIDKGVENLDTKEFGEVADIIKDLCEAEYYAKISKAMDESEYGEDYDYMGPMEDRRYYRGQSRDSRGRYMSNRGRRGYEEPIHSEPPYWHMTPEMYRSGEWERDMDRDTHHRMYYTESDMVDSMRTSRNGREGKSGMSRRTYMETKEMHKANTLEDKQAKMKELESYAKELTEDITDMISDASNEEKALLKQKLSVLIQKIQ